MEKKNYILGVHDGHNASACLLEEGKLIYAIQEERLINQKNFCGFPKRSIEEALHFAGINADDIQHVAMASHHYARPPSKNVVNHYKKESGLQGRLADLFFKTPLYDVYKNTRRKERLSQLRQCGLNVDKVRFVEHHLCHASAVYYGLDCPKDEKILILTVDGSGDGQCATVNIGEAGEITRVSQTDKGNSLGNIYSRVTFMLGFVPWEHEYKLMGMAPYSSPKGIEESVEIFKKYLDVDESEQLKFKRKIPESTTLLYSRLRNDTEHLRFDWICAGLQKFTEDVLCKWVKACIKETGIKKVALSGGVFMNVKANKKIMELEEVEDLYVMPSCGDETNSMGAAYRTYYETQIPSVNNGMPKGFKGFYLGNDVNEDQIKASIEEYRTQGHQFKSEYVADIEKRIDELLAERQVVARCKGRMEFGARALGNRSILADPSRLDVVSEINLMVKKRDFWMPFAPVTTKERASEYINNPKHFDSPYMMLSFDTTDKKDEFMAAVHQADKTARFQILDREINEDYYNIIKEFEKITGRAVLLNTSFNLHGLPICYGPDESLHVFVNSGLKYLALGNYLISKDDLN